MAAIDTLKTFLKSNRTPLMAGGAAMGTALGATALANGPAIKSDEVSVANPQDQSDAIVGPTMVRPDPLVGDTVKGSWQDKLGQGLSTARDLGGKAREMGSDLLSRGKQLGREGIDLAVQHPVATGAAVGGAALLSYLLSRKHKKTAALSLPSLPTWGRGAAKALTSHAATNPLSTSGAAALTTGLAAGSFKPQAPIPSATSQALQTTAKAINPPAPMAAPVKPLPEPGLMEQAGSALSTYKDNLLAGDPSTVGWTGAGIGAAGILAAVLMHKHERDADEE